MLFKKRLLQGTILMFLMFLSNSVCEKKEDSDSVEDFIPTHEWKTIKEGQKVPAGLHYRINLSTGKKEAKIIDGKSDPSTSFSMVEESDENENSAPDDIEQFFKEVNKKNPEDDMPKKFRTLEEIKKELGDIELQPKSDIEVLQELFKKFREEEKKKKPDDNVIIDILRDLKYLGHQIDNGNEFYKMDGFRLIIYKNLNSTNIVVKQETLKLFSTLAQNNPKVKVHILETGGITTLLRILNLDDNPDIKNSAITALSCSLRTFPYAQNKFIEFGGLTIFMELFKTGSIKLKLKLVTLLNDFIVERQKDAATFENQEFVNVEEALYNLSWCHYLNELLQDLVIIDVNDYDPIEKCLLAMKSMISKCKDFYNKDLILRIHEQYKILAKKNEDDTGDYFTYLSNITDVLLTTNTRNETSNVLKEEL